MEHPPIVVDLTASDPPFEQVRAQLAALITSGRLRPGDRLPTVRALAGELGLAVNTVAKAYKQLEAEGLVQTGRRAGTTVATGGHQSDVAVRSAATAFAAQARGAGLDDAAVLDLVREALRSQA